MIKKLLSLLVLIFCVFIQNIRAETLHSPPYTEEQSPTKSSYYNSVFKEKTVTYTGFPIYHEPENVSANVIVKYDRNGLIDAGSYMIKAYFYSQNNVLLGTKSARLNIEKARITGVTLKKKEVTYDGTLHKLELVGELPAGVTAVYKNNAHTNAGVYKMNVRLTGKNYVTSSRNNELTILPLDISKNIHLQSQVFIYDGKPKSLSIEAPLPKGLNISYKGNNQSEVGTHTVIATITGSKNYTPIPYEMRASLTISEDSTIPKIPSLDKVVFDNLTSPYTGQPIPIIATNLPDDVSVQYSRNDFIDVGSYEIKATFYFKNILIGTKVASLTIEKARITGVTFNKTTITYNGERHTLLLKGELPEGVIAEYNNNTHINAGEYKATVKLTGDNYITSTRSNVLIIAPIDLTKMIEFNSQSFVYDGIVRSLSISTALPRELKVAYKNNYQNSVGNHIIQATISGSNNYAPMPYTMTATLAITEKEEILPKIDKIVFENSTVPYTGEIIPFEATDIPEDVTVKYNRTNLKNIGEYQVTASFYYKDILLGTKSATLTIEKARITTVKFSKKEVTYDGTSHELLLEGELPDGVTAVYKNNIHTNAGEHKVSVTLTGDNYVTSTRSNLLVILPADITKLISLGSNSFEFDGQAKSITIKGDVPKGVTLKYENNVHTNVGNYTVKATLDGSTNYTPVPYVMTATLSINEKPVVLPSIENVVFDHKTEAYTGDIIAIEATNLPNEVHVTYDKNNHINAGVYQITALFYYKDILLGTKSATLTIEKARITTVKFSKMEVTYDGNAHELLLEGELPYGVTAVYKNNVHTNAGEHKVSVTLTGDNYVTSTRSNLLVILPADITKIITLESTSHIYDGKYKSLTIKGDVPKGVTLKYENNTYSEVGNYTVKATLDGSTNYTPMPYVMTAILSINEKPVILPSIENVVFDHKTEAYTAEVIAIEATNLPNEVRVTYDKNNHINTGVYQITASFYYKDILLGTKSATLTIEKARITTVKFSKKEVTYDGNSHELILEGELPDGVTAVYKNNVHTNSGEHKVSVTLTGDNYVTSTRSNLLVILPADITKLITLESASYIYDGQPKSITIKGDVPKGVTLKYENNVHTNVGNYTVKATLDGSTNYTPMPYVMTATLSINEKPVVLPSIENVVFDHKTEAYTGDIITIEATNLPNGVRVAYDKNDYINAGIYQITASFYYKDILLGTKSATLTIEKARITTVKFSKKEVTYDGNVHELLLEGELPQDVTAVYKNNIHTNAGEHKASVTLTGDNYVTSTRSNLLIILPADITKMVSLESTSHIYDGKAKSITIKGDVPKGVTLKYENNTHSEVGNYTVKATLDSSANYTPMPYVMTATLSINEKPVVLPSIENVVFDHKIEAYTGDLIAIEATNLPNEVRVAYDKNNHINAGVYQITASFYYKDILLGTKSATLTIEKARITTVKFSKKEVTYDGNSHELLLEGELPQDVTAVYKNNIHTNAGEHKASVTLTGDNYVTSTRSNLLIILPADITKMVSLESTSHIYDGKAKSLTIKGDVPKGVTLKYENNTHTNVGNYTVKATLDGSTNYTPMPYVMTATLSINEKPVVLPSIENVVFDHKIEAYTGDLIAIEATNLPNEVRVTYDKNDYINAGIYQITASFYYKDILLGTKSATLTIEKARITTVKFSKKEVTYDGNSHELLLEGELPLGVTAVYKNNVHTNAGEHKVSVTLTGDNYVTSTRSNLLVILPADITKIITLESTSHIYDGKSKSLTIKGDVPKGVTLKYENNTHSEVGNYTVKATLDGSTNYTPMPYVMTATLSINEKPVVLPSIENVIFDHKTEAYTAEVIAIEATNLPNEVRVTYDKNDCINAGVYQITASFYYKDILLGTKSATLTIEKARITTVKFSKKEVTYDGNSHELILEGELPLGVTAVYKNNIHTNAGEHKVSVTLTGDNYVTSTRSNLLVILPADITKMVSLETTSFEYDGQPKSLTIKGDVPKGVTLKYVNNTHSEVGNYTVKATLDGSINYTPMSYVMTATLSITNEEIKLPSIKDVIFENKKDTYTTEVITIEATNLPNEVRVTYDKNNHINAGIYQITASFYYKDILLGTKSATLTIEKARITTVKFSKKEVTYDGTSHELILEGELPLGVTAVYKNNIHTNAGEHKVSVTLTGDNYVTSTRSNLLVILPADITKVVSLETTSFEYDGQPKSLTIKGTIPKGVTLKYENNIHSEVGNYTVKATLDGSTNYKPMPYVMTAILSITNEEIKLPSIKDVIFENKKDTYTAEIIAIEATNLPNEVRVTYDKNDYINAGVYQITALFYYKDILLGTKSATLTIEKARITTVKFSKKEVTYDGNAYELLLEGELPQGVTAVYKNNVHTNAGEHKVSVTLTGDNYVTSTRSNLLVILPADITKMVSLETTSFEYDGQPKSLTIKGNVPKGVTLKYENNIHSEVGNYTVKATLDGSTNYTPMPYVMTAILSITNEEIKLPSIKDVIFENKKDTYTAEVIAIEATNLPNEVRVAYDKNDYINAGIYQITASFYYKDILLGTKSATLTIEKARITTVKFSKKEVTYDGNSHELLLEGELPQGVTAVYKNNVHTNTGEHKVSVTLTGDNYVTSTRSNLLVILPADITKLVSLETTSFEYDGQPKSLTIKGDVPKGVTLKYENNTHSEVGNYTVKATLDGSTNYTPMPYVMTATLIITEDEEGLLPNLDKVIFKDKAAIYSGIPYKIEATNVPKNVTTKYSENSFVSVGTYSITASFYYKEILLGTRIATLTVEKARIEDIKFSKKEVVYTGSVYELLIEGELPKGVTAIYKNNIHTNAGEHKASVTLVGDNYVTSTRSNLLIILPADISKLVELRNQSFKYDGKEKSLTIKGSVPTGISLKYENNTHTELGHYTVKATLDGSPNYTPMPYVMTATLFITQEETELPSLDKVIFRNRTETYNGNSFKLEATNLPNDVTVEYDRNYYDNAGEYTVTATFFHKTILLGKKIAVLTIEKAKLTNITFNRKTVDYNGKPQHILISGKLPKGVSATYENNVHTDAGAYKASVTLEGENYVTSNRTSTFTISPLHISKFISFGNSAYLYDGEPKTVTLTGNLPSGLNVVYENNIHTEIGVYQVKATITGNPNYTPMPYIIVATLVIRNDKERADIEQISINEQVYDMPNNKITYFLPCGQDTVLIDISELSEGAFVANNIKHEYKMHYSGTITIPIVVKSQTQTLTRNYTIELVRPVPFEKVALRGADNSYEVNLTSSTNGGYNYTAFAWYRNNVLMSNDKYFLVGANGDNTDNANAVYQLILTTDKGETVYSCPSKIEILNTNKIKLYPNPIKVTEQLNIIFDFDSSTFTLATIEIYSILGQKVLEAELSSRENNIQLPTGIQVGKYIAIININGQKKTINFIVK